MFNETKLKLNVDKDVPVSRGTTKVHLELVMNLGSPASRETVLLFLSLMTLMLPWLDAAKLSFTYIIIASSV